MTAKKVLHWRVQVLTSLCGKLAEQKIRRYIVRAACMACRLRRLNGAERFDAPAREQIPFVAKAYQRPYVSWDLEGSFWKP